jgi:hypothetical protein
LGFFIPQWGLPYAQSPNCKAIEQLVRFPRESLDRITKMEEKVRPIFNQIIQTVQLFYEENKDLSRKDYAIKITNTPNMKIYMPLLMNLYLRKENDYKYFAISHMKDIFGIVEDTNTNIDQDE